MEELLEALVVEELEPELTLEEVLQDKLTPSDVVECCKSLVIYEKSSGLVRFTHFTVQEFIQRNAQEILPPETRLALTCLVYLAFPEFDGPFPAYHTGHTRQQLRQKYKFIEYAAQSWKNHTKGEAESCPEVQRAFLYAFGRPDKANVLLGLKNSRWKVPTKDPVMCIVCKYGLTALCQLMLNGDLDDMYWHLIFDGH